MVCKKLQTIFVVNRRSVDLGMHLKSCIYSALLLFLSACDFSEVNFEVSNVHILEGMMPKEGNYRLEMDLNNAFQNGIVIPSDNQDPGFIRFSLDIKGTPNEIIYYKVYYQNKKYKLEENDPLSHENFYGSWENPDEVRSVKIPDEGIITIKDSLRIMGNPRNEEKYYGGTKLSHAEKELLIKSYIEEIESNPEWLNSIKEKSNKSGRSLSEQLHMDAVYMANQKEDEGSINNRWKRNPRTGTYEFSILVFNEGAFQELDSSVLFLSQKSSSGEFINPWSIIKSEKSGINWVWIPFQEELSVFARYTGANGIYVDRFKYPGEEFSDHCFTEQCGDHKELFQNALFEQYFHMLHKDKNFNNIDASMDVVGENMSNAQFEEYSKWPDHKRLKDHFYITDCPCKTVAKNENAIELSNPGNQSRKDKRKEQVGIISRIGLTYGTYRAKIKFPELLSSNNVWNGLTNAFWLLYQSESKWNERRVCSDQGYIPKHVEMDASVRVPTLNYSEIDFEIIKTSQYWPKTSYGNNSQYPNEDARLNSDIIVACTNWDMACRDPKTDIKGVVPFRTKEGIYNLHRWDDYHQAITLRSPQNEDELFKSDFYYFEIEWKPEEINWRIGPSKDKMRLICKMNTEVTSVPNNQMVMVITQEFHYGEWWPPVVYHQDNIPFPSKDLKGIVYEIEVD
ncbi:MAG TPA: hypothetical protein PKH65_00170 [Bacteroidia bacterium]|nr:hypothetical protein [Bacteroidia bacterium]HNT79067.1 hypothetical protein [Bacteroidia bacterium]